MMTTVEEPPSTDEATAVRRNVRRHLALAVGLVLFDAVVVPFHLPMIFFAASLLIGIPLILVRLVTAHWARAWMTVKVIMIYLVAAAGTLALTIKMVGISKDRAQPIIYACEAYKRSTGNYPKTLEELVPEYLERIPKAKPGFVGVDYRYLARPDNHTIVIRAFPPSSYVLEQGTWFTSN